MSKKYFVFDVESVGLHGEGFAVGFVVVDDERNQLDSGAFACPVNSAKGGPDGFAWCSANIPPLVQTHTSPWLMRTAFLRKCMEWTSRETLMAAEVPFPVETRFLAACIDDNPVGQSWFCPYPLLDIASIRMAAGLDPLADEPRTPAELPKHDPLRDARQSARLLLEALKALSEKVADARA